MEVVRGEELVEVEVEVRVGVMGLIGRRGEIGSIGGGMMRERIRRVRALITGR